MKECCPCCTSKTLEKLGADEICPVFFWHDDGQNHSSADEIWGGPNELLSLTAARINYRHFGPISSNWISHVRPPKTTSVSTRF
ncbi:MAG: hypothetical protein H7343_13005 [Undibacterium sp.]|nr:hypothetical protein [Opitutaceae bacterium]